ncbi:hypothetical protein PR048_025769 [Dryococelus australis]|uniref:Uncharacterized protein n=1 Tax=Dryococelus australis TaxID=614101 RepID=A0ABQ9GJH4_9NEOP|nr:hypothetical protein PR048_025769 [Dryococelus australis]
MSPTECVWRQLKGQLPLRHGVRVSEQTVQQSWARLSEDNIRCQLDSMLDHVAVCITVPYTLQHTSEADWTAHQKLICRVSSERLIEARYRWQNGTLVDCFARRGDERVDAPVSVAPSAPTLLGLSRAKFLQPGGHLNTFNIRPAKLRSEIIPCNKQDARYLYQPSERLACSSPTKANRVQSSAGSHRILAIGNRTGRCHGRGVFSGISSFPRPFIPALLHFHLTLPSSALKNSLLRAAQISQLISDIRKKNGSTSLDPVSHSFAPTRRDKWVTNQPATLTCYNSVSGRRQYADMHVVGRAVIFLPFTLELVSGRGGLVARLLDSHQSVPGLNPGRVDPVGMCRTTSLIGGSLRTSEVIRLIMMEEYTTCIQVDLKQDFHKSSVYPVGAQVVQEWFQENSGEFQRVAMVSLFPDTNYTEHLCDVVWNSKILQLHIAGSCGLELRLYMVPPSKLSARALRGAEDNGRPISGLSALVWTERERERDSRHRRDEAAHQIFITYSSAPDSAHGMDSRGKLRIQGQEAREQYGRQLHARIAPHRSYAQGVQSFRRDAVVCKLDL